jgi:hypothetical protein
MKSVPTGATFLEPEDLPRRRTTPSLDALAVEAIKGRILNSAQAAEYWGVSVPHWRPRCIRTKGHSSWQSKRSV